MYACMHTKCAPTSLYTYLMSLNKYDFHIANMNHTAIMLYGHIDPMFLHKPAKTQTPAISTSLVIAMYGPATNMPLNMPHIQMCSCVHMTQLGQYICLI